MPSHRLIQITDPHLGSREDYQLLGLNTLDSLNQVVASISASDLVVATGDISANADEGAYQQFTSAMRARTEGWCWLPGNHDDPAAMERVAPGRHIGKQDLGAWRLLMLDTSVEGKVYGGLSEAQLQQLQQDLDEAGERPVLILMHHQPVAVGSDWIDAHMLRDADRFLDVVGRFRNVRAIAWGHVHQAYEGHFRHIHLYATPSTCVQFRPGSAPFSVGEELPGYRWFELAEDGTFATGVERVHVADYTVDLASGGY